ncbi:hypothetical protein GCM10027271_42600 [Saccharopolyspora gloriosae]|uniref:DNA-binding SARP family transcriptional activator n=1 Tax=Saccharopolyspora gloriosae TaxID=455344 RepID=A0A840NFS5_9PSEU|nr:LysM peptidoglycan-binding domain-containing protein [Saccharopolyspora gloriosae]MBB5070444.1 DNA-binding SARP family transcriptional activator [Saccharopolyspora gloriosae]
MILLLAFLRRLPILLGLLILLTVLPAMLVLGTQWLDWPHLTWPPLHTGFLGEFEPAHFRAWTVDSYHEIRLTLGIDGFVIGGCLLFMWALWGVMICWITEDTYLLLRYGARQLREHGPNGARGWITALVTGTVLLGTATPSLASALPHTPVAASAPRHPGGPHRAPPEAPRAAPETDGHHAHGPSVSGPTVFVHRGDSLWLLAKTHLGDGNRWPEITELNPHLSCEPQFLLVGQTLRMPDDAAHTRPPPLPEGVRWITVGNDDTLTSLAQHHLDDPERWQEIFDLNAGRTQPSNRTLRYPHILIPGWRLALPPANTTINPTAQPAHDEPEPHPQPPSGRSEPVGSPAGPAPTAPPAQFDRTPADRPSGSSLAPGVIAALSAAGVVSAAALLRYRFRLRHAPTTEATPLPVVYPLPVALHRTRLDNADHGDDEPAAPEPAEGAGPSATRDSGEPVTEPGRQGTAGGVEAESSAAEPAFADTEEADAGLEIVHTPAPSPAALREPVPAPPTSTIESEPRLRITLFGPLSLHYGLETDQRAREVTENLQPRMRELLAFVALHPAGVSRGEFLDALWTHSPNTNAFNTALSRLRHALATIDPNLAELIRAGSGRYRLDPDRVTVDYWEFTTALASRRGANTDTDRFAADEHIIATYHGTLVTGIDAAWAEPLRERARRVFLEAVAACARALHHHDSQRTLALLENAGDLAPAHEPLYRDIMRLQSHLGHHESIPRTFALLQTRLADLGISPSADTRSLAVRLTQRP